MGLILLFLFILYAGNPAGSIKRYHNTCQQYLGARAQWLFQDAVTCFFADIFFGL